MQLKMRGCATAAQAIRSRLPGAKRTQSAAASASGRNPLSLLGPTGSRTQYSPKERSAKKRLPTLPSSGSSYNERAMQPIQLAASSTPAASHGGMRLHRAEVRECFGYCGLCGRSCSALEHRLGTVETLEAQLAAEAALRSDLEVPLCACAVPLYIAPAASVLAALAPAVLPCGCRLGVPRHSAASSWRTPTRSLDCRRRCTEAARTLTSTAPPRSSRCGWPTQRRQAGYGPHINATVALRFHGACVVAAERGALRPSPRRISTRTSGRCLSPLGGTQRGLG